MKLFTKFLVATPLLFTFATASAEVPRENWSETCKDASISEGVLSATCTGMDGSEYQTSIDTNMFIGNIDGTLMSADSSGEIPRKDWSKTCKDASMSGGTLSATCTRMNGSEIPSSIDTDLFIGNIDGVLKTDL